MSDDTASSMDGPVIGTLDRLLERVFAAARWLVAPLALLLFLQWPLRDFVHAGSRQANDLAQCIFALYVSIALTEATRRRSHLAARPVSERWAARWRRPLEGAALLLAVLPWSLYVLQASSALVWQSLRQLEGFPETTNPGYFIVKLSLWVLAGAMTAQALLDLARLFGRRT
ncbi:MAG: TRAP transporter small permease subunit [Caldimonas sp.]